MDTEMLSFVIEATAAKVRREYEDKERKEDEKRKIGTFDNPTSVNHFWVDREVGDLVEPCRRKAAKHREREVDWTAKLEEAEKELREKGVSVEVFDQNTGTYQTFNYSPAAVASGSIASGQIGCFHMASGALSTAGGSAPNFNHINFKPRVDEKMMDAVKNAKNKMLDHRQKAETYEKQARAFACAPDRVVRLSIDDVTYFGLEG